MMEQKSREPILENRHGLRAREEEKTFPAEWVGVRMKMEMWELREATARRELLGKRTTRFQTEAR